MPTELERIRLEKRRDAAIAQLRTLGNLTRGTLYSTGVRCGRPGCECESGAKHVKLHLSVRFKGRSRNVYVGEKRAEEVAALVAEYKRAWRLIEELTEVNLELLRPTRNRRGGKEVAP
jgi:hypothetical protein